MAGMDMVLFGAGCMILGGMIGASVGLLMYACCYAARRGDRCCKCFLKEWPRFVRARKTREESWGISPNGLGRRNCRWRKLVRVTMWWNRRKWENGGKGK